MTERKSMSFVVFLVSALIGLLGGALVAGVVGYWRISGERHKVQRGWTLEYRVAAARDLPAGTTLDMSHIMQVPIPEQYATGSSIAPDSLVHVIRHELTIPLQRGDLLRWADFESCKCPPPDEGE